MYKLKVQVQVHIPIANLVTASTSMIIRGYCTHPWSPPSPLADNLLTTPALAPDEQKNHGVAAGVLPRLETILIRKASDRVRLRAGAERLADATSSGA